MFPTCFVNWSVRRIVAPRRLLSKASAKMSAFPALPGQMSQFGSNSGDLNIMMELLYGHAKYQAVKHTGDEACRLLVAHSTTAFISACNTSSNIVLALATKLAF
jgi:hypothetical protein